ncbi:hypothetical protein [Marinibactrum halimedae]|uniref:Uncharacterized protein n=1 Tax=Marinibactrum halimedae TaxID=1444977 RepID=A0AA37WL34_9GAMM|nr:hypothetical protein [Marinibactrum halimedae]MCD9457796.1 hypothetical protein [Marinibactrum halimedae]GLS24830.1 hypothetical protein GCM10007877_05440 [Marinibactrum halimedae]
MKKDIFSGLLGNKDYSVLPPKLEPYLNWAAIVRKIPLSHKCEATKTAMFGRLESIATLTCTMDTPRMQANFLTGPLLNAAFSSSRC